MLCGWDGGLDAPGRNEPACGGTVRLASALDDDDGGGASVVTVVTVVTVAMRCVMRMAGIPNGGVRVASVTSAIVAHEGGRGKVH